MNNSHYYQSFIKSVQRWSLIKYKKHVVSCCKVLSFISGSALALVSSSVASFASPTGGNITHGSGGIEYDGKNTNITQDSQRLDIDWTTFSTQADEAINFTQPNSDALVINRVIGNLPSHLKGALNANGRVFVLNKNGVTFYGTSTVNVGSLLTTTANNINEISEGKYELTNLGDAVIINHGDISVSNGGFAAFVAPRVENHGTVQANLGRIDMVSTGSKYTIDFRGDNLITYSVSDRDLENMGVVNNGDLIAKSGIVNIFANAASQSIDNVVNLDGIIDVDSFEEGYDAGEVNVLSENNINLNDVKITANGGTNGNGGKVITKAKGLNDFSKDAVIEAKGGRESGDGGFIEISGEDIKVGFLNSENVNTSATNGKGGTLLIDPREMTIENGGTTLGANAIGEEYIETRSQGGQNTTIEANELIVMEDLTDDVLQGGNGDITLLVNNKEGGIKFMDTNDSIKTTGGDISLTVADFSGSTGTTAHSTPFTAGSIEAGKFEIGSKDNYSDATNPTITIKTADGNISLKGASIFTTGSVDSAKIDISATGGVITNTGGENISSKPPSSNDLASVVNSITDPIGSNIGNFQNITEKTNSESMIDPIFQNLQKEEFANNLIKQDNMICKITNCSTKK